MKRVFDVTIAALGLFIAAPLWIPIAILVKLSSPGSVLYRQKRPGLRGQPFTILKFRTMRDLRDATGKLLPDAERLTRIGKFIRSTSLDELPELINVLKGEMSLVGPRPLMMEYLDRYTPEQARRHNVKPGITGWAQVNGRNALTWEQKFALDIWYVDNRSLWLDSKILFLTLLIVIKREGVSATGHVTMPEFRGSSQK